MSRRHQPVRETMQMPHDSSSQVWVIDHQLDSGTLERLGDCRAVADRLQANVGVLLVGCGSADTQRLIAGGADHVCHAHVEDTGQMTAIEIAADILKKHLPRLVLAPGDCAGREWAARLAVRAGWTLVSPVLSIRVRNSELELTHLGATGRHARRLGFGPEVTVIATMRNGVGDAAPQNDERTGSVTIEQYTRAHEFISRREIRQADPQSADIRFVDRLVAGGRGLGGRDGFEALRCFAGRINAGIAASRMAVDLGWIEHERQVGQTGKSIAPKLYVACGISGANHHIEGMKTAEHIVAINTDRNAPIFKVAHLGLVADLFAVLQETQKGIDD